MIEIDEYIHRQLIAFGIVNATEARWKRLDSFDDPLDDSYWIACLTCRQKCTYRHIVIRDRSLAMTQCKRCLTIYWADWHVSKPGTIPFFGAAREPKHKNG